MGCIAARVAGPQHKEAPRVQQYEKNCFAVGKRSISDFQTDRKGDCLADARNPQKPLDLLVGHQVRMQRALQIRDLGLEQFGLPLVALCLRLVERRQGAHTVQVGLFIVSEQK